MKELTMNLIISLSLLLFSACGDDTNKTEVVSSGNIEAISVTISSKVTGEILELKKDEGDRVFAGDTIMIIDNEALQYQLQQALASVEVNEAQLGLLTAGAREEDIRHAEELLKQAEINNTLAANDRQRMSNLFEAKSITKKQMEDAAARSELTAAQLRTAEENLRKIKNLARPEEIKQARANLKKQIAAADLLKKSINDSYVIAPVAGIISRKFVEKGEMVMSFTSLCRISSLEVVDLVIYIPETELGQVKPGNKADITVDSYPERKFTGEVIYISPEAEFTPKNIQTKDERTKLVFAVKIRIKNPELELKAGMPADAVVYFN